MTLIFSYQSSLASSFIASLKAKEGLLKGLSDSSNALEAEVGGGDLVLLLIAGLPSVNILILCFTQMQLAVTTMPLPRSYLLIANDRFERRLL